MKLSKIYQISTVLLILFLASFSANAAHHQTKTAVPKKEIRKQSKVKDLVSKFYQKRISKKLKKGSPDDDKRLISSILSLVLGTVSVLAWVFGLIILISQGSWALIILSLVAAIVGTVFFIISLASKRNSDYEGSLVASIIGVILSIGGAFASIITMLIGDL